GETCDASGQCQGSSSCNEDEPNNKSSQATSVCASGTVQGAISTKSDVDWFSWSQAKGAFSVTLSQLPADYTMTLYRRSASGSVTKVSTATDHHDQSDQTIQTTARTAATYLVKISGVNGAHASDTYQVTVTR